MIPIQILIIVSTISVFAGIGAWAFHKLKLRKRIWARIAELRGWKLKTVYSPRQINKKKRNYELFLADPQSPSMPTFENAKLTVDIDARPHCQEIPRVVSILHELESEIDGFEVRYEGSALTLEGPWTSLDDDPESSQETVLAIENAVSEVEHMCLQVS